jgi:hypothetical protein
MWNRSLSSRCDRPPSDPWPGDSKRKCTLTYTPLSLDKFLIEYPLFFLLIILEFVLGLTQLFVRKVQLTFMGGATIFSCSVIFLKKVELNSERISE